MFCEIAEIHELHSLSLIREEFACSASAICNRPIFNITIIRKSSLRAEDSLLLAVKMCSVSCPVMDGLFKFNRNFPQVLGYRQNTR